MLKNLGEKKTLKGKLIEKIELPDNVFKEIDSILNNLSNTGHKPDYNSEKKRILNACKNSKGKMEMHTYEFDLQLTDINKGYIYFLEMKGPDPNTTEVPGAKRRLLSEMAWGFLNSNAKEVEALFAIYYNNQYPKTYSNPKVVSYFDTCC